jgi:hypothetical protein
MLLSELLKDDTKNRLYAMTKEGRNYTKDVSAQMAYKVGIASTKQSSLVGHLKRRQKVLKRQSARSMDFQVMTQLPKTLFPLSWPNARSVVSLKTRIS